MERVHCFPRKLLEELGIFQGISFEVEKYFPAVTSPLHALYLSRTYAERDKRFKQLIPYVLLICNGKILRYQRSKSGQETRLHGLYSVGVGGHILDEDFDYWAGMWREVGEEVGAVGAAKESAVAVINDDSTEVGYVHFGVVHVMQIFDERFVESPSGDIACAEFIPIDEAVKNTSDYEAWSRLCLESYEHFLVSHR